MKISLPLCLCVLFAAGFASASGQVAPHPHSLNLDAEPLSTGGSLTTSAGTKNNVSPTTGRTSYKTTKTETSTERESVQISVHNFGQLPDTVQVEWYFVAGPAKPDLSVPVADQQFIFDKGSKSLTIAPGGTENFPVSSAEISSEFKRSSKSKYSKAGNKDEAEETGSVLGGWMVRLVAEGRTLDARASKDKLAEVVKDDAQLARMKGH